MEQTEIIKILDDYFSQNRKFIDTSRIPLICQDIRGIHVSLETMNEKLDKQFVNQDQFWPIKSIVYGGVGIILVSVFTALIYLVLQ